MGKKNIKQYFVEFLMMFLAVTLGFFAENMRENLGQRAKEREFVLGLIRDFEVDTLLLHNNLPRQEKYVSALDSLIDETYEVIEGKGDTRTMYYYYHHYLRSAPARPILVYQTLDQLTNTADIDIIQNHKVKTMILLYATIKNSYNIRFEEEQKIQQSAIDFGLNIFDFKVYQHATADSVGHISGLPYDDSEEGILKLSNQPPLISKDPVLLRKFSGIVGFHRNHENTMITGLKKNLAPRFEKFIKRIVEEYKIDNETLRRIHDEIDKERSLGELSINYFD